MTECYRPGRVNAEATFACPLCRIRGSSVDELTVKSLLTCDVDAKLSEIDMREGRWRRRRPFAILSSSC
jgi:hypothetical protein